MPDVASKLTYNRRAERPIVQMWLFDESGTALIDFSNPSYSFSFRVGKPGYSALLNKTIGVNGGVGSGVSPTGSGNITVTWDVGDLDLEPGLYQWQLTATITGLDRVFEGLIHILDEIDA